MGESERQFVGRRCGPSPRNRDIASPAAESSGHPANSAETLDRAAFAEQLESAYARLWALAVGILGDRNEAEDVVQEAAVVALRRLDQFTPGTNFLAWMAKIVRWQAFNWARKRIGRRTEPVDPAELDRQQTDRQTAPQQSSMDANSVVESSRSGNDTGELTAYQGDFDDILMRSLHDLRPDARTCLLLRVVHELSYREISDLMEIAEGTAMSHVHRAKKALREKITHTADAATMRSRQPNPQTDD